MDGVGFIVIAKILLILEKFLQDMGKHILSNFNSIDSNFDNCLWLNDLPQTNDLRSDIKSLIDLCKHFPDDPLVGYIDINSLKE